MNQVSVPLAKVSKLQSKKISAKLTSPKYPKTTKTNAVHLIPDNKTRINKGFPSNMLALLGQKSSIKLNYVNNVYAKSTEFLFVRSQTQVSVEPKL